MTGPGHKPDLEATAYHEAGHTFIAWLCGHEIKDLTIKPDPSKGWAGSMRHRESGFDLLFDDPFALVPNPDAPGQNLVRIEGTKARHLTQGEGRYFELVENLSDVSPYERDVIICVAGELAQ